MALNSPGVQVTIIDESQYLPAAPNSVPLIILATAENKSNAANTGVAQGTLAANANKLYAITSQRDLVTYFGNPFFYKSTNGTSIHGYELNEYGLQAAYSLLGGTNLVYVVRADIDLAEIVGRTGRPSTAPDSGQYWLDSLNTTWGIFEFSSSTGTFVSKAPIVINETTKQADPSTGQPNSDIGNIGDYAVNLTTNYGFPDTYQTYWYKNISNQWVSVGSAAWQASLPTLQATKAPTTTTPGTIVFATNSNIQTFTGYIDDDATPGTYAGSAGTTLTVSSPITIADNTYITGQGILPGTFIAVGGTGTSFSINTSQAVAPATIKGQIGFHVTTAATTVAGVVADLNSAQIPQTTVASVNGRLTFYTSGRGSVTITSASTPTTLSSLGISAGTYNPPALSYGSNAQQPLWRSTDTTPRPTGSVWIKTNSVNSGMNIEMSQFDAATATWFNLAVKVTSNDWAINDILDSAGGKNIPINTVYAQANGFGTDTPVQLFSRAASGPSVFVGSTTTVSTIPGSAFNVYISTPGSSSLTGPYVVTMLGTNAADFVTSWTAANIPYTTAVVDTTGAIVITHTEGGVIILDDSPSTFAASPVASPVSAAGFSVYDPSTSSGTLGVKYGPFMTVDETYAGTAPLATTTNIGIGSGLTVNLTTSGTVPTFTVNAGGTSYAPGDVVTVTSILTGNSYKLQVTSVGLNASGTPTAFGTGAVSGLTLVSGIATPAYTLQLSNWEIFDYISDTTAPVKSPATGTKWYHSVANQVDIMTNYGGEWFSYNKVKYGINGLPVTGTNAGNNPTGPICQASAPETQTDGTALVYGDLWIDTGDLENYPVISRWQQVGGVDQWVLIDNTDQTSENGILFADARWGADGTVDPVNDPIPTISSLLTAVAPAASGNEAYVDLDAPSASEYPSGCLLFNTRLSGYVVKEFRVNYFNGTDFADQTLPVKTSSWVTISGNKSNGSPYMGRKAQRAVIVKALKVCTDTTFELRDDQTFYNLIACPGYPELQPNMVALNNDRNNTSYIIGDTPLRLKDDANDIVAWATNKALATSSGEDGLVTRDTYLGIYYPSGITTDLTGAEIVVPASHMILRTMLHNDQMAYPWFAPAGQRRGTIDNANNIGYINATTGEFQVTQNRNALRDIEYTNFINPIAFFNNLGLLNFGNKNSFDSQSALDRTNVSRLICYLRDRLAVAVRPFLFEPNDAITRVQVRNVCQSLLADIMAKRGVYDYLVVCDESNNTPARIDRNELWIDIAIEPVKAVEFIYIPVRILNTGEIAGLQ